MTLERALGIVILVLVVIILVVVLALIAGGHVSIS